MLFTVWVTIIYCGFFLFFTCAPSFVRGKPSTKQPMKSYYDYSDNTYESVEEKLQKQTIHDLQ